MARRTRREILTTVGVTGAVAVAGCGSSEETGTTEPEGTETASGTAGPWPMFSVDATNVGALPEQSGPREDITTQWSVQTNGNVYSSPAVVDGTVYVGSGDQTVYAIGAASGEEQWSFDTDDVVFSSPAVVDGTVYVGCHDHNLYAIDAESGEGQVEGVTTKKGGTREYRRADSIPQRDGGNM